MVKKTKKPKTRRKKQPADRAIASADVLPAQQLPISVTVSPQPPQAAQSMVVLPLSQITASQLGLEILHSHVRKQDASRTPVVETAGRKPGNGVAGKTSNSAQKEDWLRPDTTRSAGEEDRLLGTQSRLLKRRFDTMREELGVDSGEEDDESGSTKKQKMGYGGVVSLEEGLGMERPGSEKEWLRERLEYNLAEREALLRRWGQLD